MLKKIFCNIKYIKIGDIFSIFIFVIALFPALIFRLLNIILKRELWLVCENGETARDNGYHFYKYVRNNHPNDFCYYVINKKSYDYGRVKDFGNIIQFKSFKHWVYYLSANYNISNHKNGNPNQPFFFVLHVYFNLFNNRVFLQHGIIKDDLEWLYYKNTKFRYFICGAEREYEFVKEKFGYPNGYVVYTGLSRFDNLYDNNVDYKQLLFMPTWRNWIGRETNLLVRDEKFTNTDFFKYWNDLLINDELINFIEKNNIKILFYPHINMQKFLNDFVIKSKNIEICSANNKDIQELLKKSYLLVTDYSSVYMDFGYMGKPVIYYQFDYDIYRKKQYADGYYSYSEDGFGPVCKSCDQVIFEIKNIVHNGLNKKYFNRMNDFFTIKDQNNSKRIYDILKGEK